MVDGATYVYVGSGKEKYRVKNLKAPLELCYSDWWCMDTQEDYAFFDKICTQFGQNKTEFLSTDLVDWLKENPQIIEINSDVR